MGLILGATDNRLLLASKWQAGRLLSLGATDNRLLLASKWQAGRLLSLGATDKLVCPCGSIAGHQMLATSSLLVDQSRLFDGCRLGRPHGRTSLSVAPNTRPTPGRRKTSLSVAPNKVRIPTRPQSLSTFGRVTIR
jgi:hypothetical protein